MTCDNDCTAPLCGDGLTNAAASEACDDGRRERWLRRRLHRGRLWRLDREHDCRRAVRRRRRPDGELRDQLHDACLRRRDPQHAGGRGLRRREHRRPGDGCSATCVVEICGDGIVNNSGTEECDDGNTSPGDGCNATCVAEFCGDGIVNNSGTEACDDGNTTPGDGCSATVRRGVLRRRRRQQQRHRGLRRRQRHAGRWLRRAVRRGVLR